MNNKSNTLLLTVIGVATLLVAVIGASFAYFTAQIGGVETATTLQVQAGTLSIVYDGSGGALMMPKGDAVNGLIPITDGGSVMEKTFTLTGSNSTDTQMPYSLHLKVANNNFTSGALVFSLTGTNVNSNGTLVPNRTLPNLTYVDNDQIAGVISTIAEENKIPTGTNTIDLGVGYFTGVISSSTHRYKIEVYFPETGVDQDEDKGRTLSASIEARPAAIVEQ